MSTPKGTILDQLHYELKGKTFRSWHVHSMHRATLPAEIAHHNISLGEVSQALAAAGVKIVSSLPDAKRTAGAQACFCNDLWQPVPLEDATRIAFNDAAINALTEKGVEALANAKADGFRLG